MEKFLGRIKTHERELHKIKEICSELGLAAVFNNYSAIPDLLTTCDVNARASFLNGQIGWFFSKVPILSLAVFGDALEIITELVEVIVSIVVENMFNLILGSGH